MAGYRPRGADEHVLDWTLGHWKRPEYNTPEGRAQLVRLIDAAHRLDVKPTTLNMWKARYDTFPDLVATAGATKWFVWEEVAYFAAGLGYGDPALVATAKRERIDREIAERVDELDRLKAECLKLGPDCGLEDRIHNLRISITRWRKKLTEHDPPIES